MTELDDIGNPTVGKGGAGFGTPITNPEMDGAVSPYPNLSGVASEKDQQTKGGGKFSAAYINWAKVAHYLHEHAPGWQPACERNVDGGLEHRAPDGSLFLLVHFTHPVHGETQPVPHAVMDNRNDPVAGDKVSSRDLSDAFVRGMCKAAALTFGLAWQLWTKTDPLSRDDDVPKDEPPAQVDPNLLPFLDGGEALAAIDYAMTTRDLDKVIARLKVSPAIGADEKPEIKDALKQRGKAVAK